MKPKEALKEAIKILREELENDPQRVFATLSIAEFLLAKKQTKKD